MLNIKHLSVSILALLIPLLGCSDCSGECCDGLDNDGDGVIDEGSTDIFYADLDLDGFGDAQAPIEACEPADGIVTNYADCDDSDPLTYPDANELCDRQDNDCDRIADEGIEASFDLDDDGYLDAAACKDAYSPVDCDDRSSDVYPGAPELCNRIDDNCQGGVDEGFDADGDGYRDPAACAQAYPQTDCNDQAASIYPGALDRCHDGVDQDCNGADLSCVAARSLTTDQATSAFDGIEAGEYAGYPLAAVGDLTGDGLDDVLVGASYNSENGDRSGHAYLLSGALPTQWGDLSTAAATFIGEGEVSHLGVRSTPLGDLNADGHADVALAAPYFNLAGERRGRVYLYYGPVTGEQLVSEAPGRITGENRGDQLGWSLSGGGDLDGDGRPDLAISAYSNDAAANDAGQVYLFLSSDMTRLGGDIPLGSAAVRILGLNTNHWLGFSIAIIGDTNGDGLDDIAIGALGDDAGGEDAGAVYLILGRGAGQWPASADITQLADAMWTGEAAGDAFGRSISAAGDVNDDGLADTLVGAPYASVEDAYAGRAYLFLGSESPPAERGAADADAIFPGLSVAAWVGANLAGGGDIGGDGIDDFVIGVDLADTTGEDAGTSFVFMGGEQWGDPQQHQIVPLESADLLVHGAAALDLAGSGVSVAADLDDDGTSELIVGAPWNDDGGDQAGKVYVFKGGL